MTTVIVVLLTILAAVVATGIHKLIRDRRIAEKFESRARVSDIMEAREQLKRLQKESTQNREDFKKRLEAYNEKYNRKPDGSSKPSGDSSGPSSDM